MNTNEALEGEFPLHTLDAKDESNNYIMTVKLPERLLQEIAQNAGQIAFEESGPSEMKLFIGNRSLPFRVVDEKPLLIDCISAYADDNSIAFSQIGNVFKRLQSSSFNLDQIKLKNMTEEANKKEKITKVLPSNDKNRMKAPKPKVEKKRLNSAVSGSSNSGAPVQKKPKGSIPPRMLLDKPIPALMDDEDTLKDMGLVKPEQKYLTKPSITDRDEYYACKKEFEEKYETYKLIDTVLNKNTYMFKEIYSEYKKEADSSLKLKYKEYLQRLFATRKQDIEVLTSYFSYLHDELSDLKARITNFVNSQQQQ